MAITQYYFRQAKSIGWLRPRWQDQLLASIQMQYSNTGNVGVAWKEIDRTIDIRYNLVRSDLNTPPKSQDIYQITNPWK